MNLDTPSPRRAADAALLGLDAGLRSMTPLAALALRGRLGGPPPLRWVLLAAAAGELVGDKLPSTPSRTAPLVLGGRFATAAIAGGAVAGPAGAVAAAAAAGLSSVVGERARAALGRRTGLPDPAIAVAEDAIAVGLAVAVVSQLG